MLYLFNDLTSENRTSAEGKNNERKKTGYNPSHTHAHAHGGGERERKRDGGGGGTYNPNYHSSKTLSLLRKETLN